MSNTNRAFAVAFSAMQWGVAAYFATHGGTGIPGLFFGAVFALIAITPWKDKK